MSKQIRLDDRVYERIKSAKRDDERSAMPSNDCSPTARSAISERCSTRSRSARCRAAIEAADEQDRQAVTETAERFE